MTQSQIPNTDWRNQEIKIDPFVYQLAIGIFLIIVATLIGFLLFPNGDGYLTNLYTTGIGVLITVAYLDRRAERRDALRTETELKARLIREMGSQVNEVAIHATEELRAKQWLLDGSLVGERFTGANLQRSNLWNANLQEANLSLASLQEADFPLANLQSAKLLFADFQKARLHNVNLRQANLSGANLQDAKLQKADLRQARLSIANLQYADLSEAQYDKTTILPDDTYWTQDTDITRFTDPSHQHFWRSDNSISPAYRGSTTTQALEGTAIIN